MRDRHDLQPMLPPWLICSILVVGVLAFVRTLSGGFLGDDFVYVARFHSFPWSEWPRLFVREWSEGIWGFQLSELRPFAAFSFMLDAQLYGGNPLGYRLTNLALHLAVLLAVVVMTWRYSDGSRLATLTAGLIFAFHPAHLEPVSWITGRVDVLSTACALWFWITAESFSDHGRGRSLLAASLWLAIGVFSKELCLFAPPLLLLYWLLTDSRASRQVWLRRGALLLVVAIVAVAYHTCRQAAFGSNATVPGSTWHAADAWKRQVSYLGWLAPILPFFGKAEFTMTPGLDTLRTIGLGAAASTLLGLLVTLGKNWQAAGRVIFFTTGWWLVTVGGLLLVGYFSPRHLYFPTTGLAIGAGLLASYLGPRTGAILAALVVAWMGAGHTLASKHWVHNGVISLQAIQVASVAANEAPPGSLILASMPAVRGTAWLWSWGCPHALGTPFVTPPFPAHRVFTDAGCYYRPETWANEFKPFPALREAPGAIVLGLAPDGSVRHRILAQEHLRAEAKRLEEKIAFQPLTSGEWTDWIQGILTPVEHVH